MKFAPKALPRRFIHISPGPIALRMSQDLNRIVKKLEASYKVLASYMTEIKMDELDKTPDNPKLLSFLLS